MSLQRKIDRVLVALDSSPQGLGALEVAAELAARHDAQLIGVYVEDIDVLRMAALPFAREYSRLSAGGRELDSSAMARAMRGQATRLRQAVAAAAEKAHVRWTFRSQRGRVSAELIAASKEADIVIVGRASGPSARRERLGSTARALASGSPRTVVLLQRGTPFGRPVLVTYDGKASADRALATAAAMALEGEEGLVVVVPAEGSSALTERASTKLRGWNIEARYVTVPRISLSALLTVLHDKSCRMLVLNSDSALFEGGSVGPVLEKIECPVVVAR